MFGSGFEVIRVFRIPIRLDLSWAFVAALITWSLATGAFPLFAPGLAAGTYWWMGAIGALGLFASVVLHELAHALTARRFGIPIRGITLFFFGGVAEMAGEPPTARSELLIAIAGPALSVGLAGAGWGASVLGGALGVPEPLTAVVGYLALMNAVLALFNLIPAFPLDGGRVLRALLWGTMKDLRRSTRVASTIGAGFGILLIGLGVLRAVWSGDLLGGVWWVLLGLFVRNAARSAWEQLVLRQSLEGEPVYRFMHPDPLTLPRSMAVSDMVRDYASRYPSRMFPVVNDAGHLLGCVTLQEIHQLPREEWDRQTLGAIAQRIGPENTISAHADALGALSLMNHTGASRLMVADGDRLLGMLSLKDLLRFLASEREMEKMELKRV